MTTHESGEIRVGASTVILRQHRAYKLRTLRRAPEDTYSRRLPADKPVILFGGLNGGGKTTFLDALQLCPLWRPCEDVEPRQARLLGIPVALHTYPCRGPVGKYSAQLPPHDRWQRGPLHPETLLDARINGRCTEEFHVLKNDRLAPTLADNWALQVEDLMPANIAHLFLFDGEQIERYASLQPSQPCWSARRSRTCLGSMSSISLKRTCGSVERRKRSEQLDDRARAKVAAAED